MFGLFTRFHEVPSQRSTSVRIRLLAFVNEPTAQASAEVRAATPDSSLCGADGPSADGVIVHDVPS